jgi:chemotaxis methyl-accepting protein methylase
MKTAIKSIRPTTINFLIEKIGKMTDHREANKLLTSLTGINTFFRNQEDFLTLLELLKPNLPYLSYL